MKNSVRYFAVKVIHQVLSHDRSLSAELPKHQASVTEQDQALLQELCFGVCRYLHSMQFWIKTLVQRPLKMKDHDILALMYVGIYQLLHTRIPDHAAISATVDVAKELDKPWAKNMVNGVLRNVQRQAATVPETWLDDPIYLYSHPKWFIKAVRSAWPEHWREVLSANNDKPPFTLRVNARHSSTEEYLQRLADAQLGASLCQHSPQGITLNNPCSVTQLPSFADGHASVQDEAAQCAANLLDLAPGQRVLDACCAPGGKTCHILEMQPDLDALWALDSDAARLTRVEENLQRLNLQAMLKVGDATQLSQWWDEQAFDRILLDAPCSATGVIRRHPDIKLLRRAQDIDALAELQFTMLQTLWQTLKPGGILVYATCSVLPKENEHVIERFLAEQTDAQQINIDANWGEARPFGRQLLPQQGGHDGFFYAKLKKAVL